MTLSYSLLLPHFPLQRKTKHSCAKPRYSSFCLTEIRSLSSFTYTFARALASVETYCSIRQSFALCLHSWFKVAELRVLSDFTSSFW